MRTNPTLILLPGLDGTGMLFQPLQEKLTNVSYTIITYPTNVNMNYSQLLDYVKKRLPNNPYVVLAESFSGPIGIRLASENPENLRGLILSTSFANSPIRLGRALAPIMQLIPVKTMANNFVVRMLMGRYYNNGIANLLSKSLEKLSTSVLKTRLTEVLKIDVRTEFASIAIPILYLQAKEDVIVRRSVGINLKKISTHMQLSEFSAPHFLLQTVPDMAAKTILDFLQKGSRK